MTMRVVDVDDFEDEVVEDEAPALPAEAVADSLHWLIDPIRVDADEMPWNYKVGGQKKRKYIQKGRWVMILPVESGQAQLLQGEVAAYAQLAANQEAGEEKMGEAARKAVEAVKLLKAEYATMVVDWNLIGWDGLPLPKPYKNPAAIHGMPSDAVDWLHKQIGLVVHGADADDADRPNATSRSRSRSTGGGRRR